MITSGPLEPVQAMTAEQAHRLAVAAVADQQWFADAPLLVIVAARVVRNFWKYRNHAKAHRALLLDAGHLSQTLYLLATEAGLAGFVTAAINEVELEQAFGLDPIHQGALAICGFGWRGQVMETAELDPADPGTIGSFNSPKNN